jgi:nickel transport protein
LVLFLHAGPAAAHKVYLFAWPEGDQVVVDAYFSGGGKVKNSAVKVHGPSGALLLEGETDEQGAFRFTPPQKTDLKLVLEAGMGHAAQFTLPAEDVPLARDAPPAKTAAAESQAAASPTEPPPAAAEPKAAPGEAFDPDALAEALAPVLEEKLAPLEASLTRMERKLAEMSRPADGPAVKDVVAGLGWIVGLMGLVMYIKSRK